MIRLDTVARQDIRRLLGASGVLRRKIHAGREVRFLSGMKLRLEQFHHGLGAT